MPPSRYRRLRRQARPLAQRLDFPDYPHEPQIVYDLTVFEDDSPIDTGLVDLDGTPIVRFVSQPIGFLAEHDDLVEWEDDDG